MRIAHRRPPREAPRHGDTPGAWPAARAGKPGVQKPRTLTTLRNSLNSDTSSGGCPVLRCALLWGNGHPLQLLA